MCRLCFIADGGNRRNALARYGQGHVRKTEPEEQEAMAARFLRAYARRARTEDPGRGLAGLVRLADLAAALRDEAGTELVDNVGQNQVADGLGWSRTRVNKRWGTGT
jgi:hypothetical protein